MLPPVIHWSSVCAETFCKKKNNLESIPGHLPLWSKSRRMYLYWINPFWLLLFPQHIWSLDRGTFHKHTHTHTHTLNVYRISNSCSLNLQELGLLLPKKSSEGGQTKRGRGTGKMKRRRPGKKQWRDHLWGVCQMWRRRCSSSISVLSLH